MGGNGTASVHGSVLNKEYVSLGSYNDPVFGEIEIIEWAKGEQNKMPTESNSAPRMYASFYKDGSGINEIAKYGNDHKKIWAIHPIPHKSIKGPHIHDWHDGKVGKVSPLAINDTRYALLKRLETFYKSR